MVTQPLEEVWNLFGILWWDLDPRSLQHLLLRYNIYDRVNCSERGTSPVFFLCYRHCSPSRQTFGQYIVRDFMSQYHCHCHTFEKIYGTFSEKFFDSSIIFLQDAQPPLPKEPQLARKKHSDLVPSRQTVPCDLLYLLKLTRMYSEGTMGRAISHIKA